MIDVEGLTTMRNLLQVNHNQDTLYTVAESKADTGFNRLILLTADN